MKKEIEYGNWDRSYGFGVRKNGNMYSYCSPGLHWHELMYLGEGKPSVCQAQRQKLLLGTFDFKTRKLKETDILFGIREINGSYYDWTGNIFEDYTIDILQGTKEDVRKIFTECVVGCDECCGCGDW